MITVLAEKPSVARELGEVLGATRQSNGYIYNDEYCITWALGHLVEIYAPEDSGAWNAEKLPFIPREFRLRVRYKNGKPDKDAERQLQVIDGLFRRSRSIIVATDAGREGTLIARYIYYYLGCNLPVQRLWISSLTRKAIEEGFKNLLPGEMFNNLYNSARARAEADWKVGINATRALTTAADIGKTLSIGRVQTPTLAIICRRYIENRNFTPEPFKVIKVAVNHDGYLFTLSSERYLDLEKAQRDLDAIRTEGSVTVTKCETHEKVDRPPLLHDITSLQQKANKVFGYSASKTLSIAQSLYEKKHLTYPRTGSRYIPEDVFAQMGELMKVAQQDADYGKYAKALEGKPLNRHSVNDTKITDHHALLITENYPSDLKDEEWDIYLLVLERMIEAFSEDCVSDQRNVEAVSAGIVLKAHGAIIRKAGWKAVEGIKKDDDEQLLPQVDEGTRLAPAKYSTIDGMTKPKPLLTEESLLEEMKNPAKDVDDEQVRKRLAEVGLGTPATRAAIIDTLFERGYVEKEKKKIIPTTLGVSIFCAVDGKDIADPVWTGKWENALEYIADGKMDPNAFDEKINRYTKVLTEDLLSEEHRKAIRFAMASETLKCPACGKTVRIVPEKAYCKDCGLTIWRTVAGKKLSDAHIRMLLEGGETEVIKGFTSKAGNKFDAALRRDTDGKIKFLFKD